MSPLATTPAALAALAPDWDDLWRRDHRATPFQSPAWQLAWWRHFGTARPVAACLWRDGRLDGLLPAYVLEEDGGKLLPIGVGISDTLDVLLAPDAPPETAGLLLAEVVRGAGRVTRVDWPDTPPNSSLRTAPAPAGWRAQVHQGAACPVLALGAGLGVVMPAAAQRKLRMNRNRAGRAGGAALHLATAETLADALETVFTLHAARWAAQGQPGGVLADPRVAACLRDAAPALLAAGSLRVATLLVGGAVAAGCVAFLAGPDRLLLYLGGFDAAHAACSPGSLLVDALAQQCVAEGRRELHFLRGEEAYKYAWGAVDRHNATLSLVPA